MKTQDRRESPWLLRGGQTKSKIGFVTSTNRRRYYDADHDPHHDADCDPHHDPHHNVCRAKRRRTVDAASARRQGRLHRNLHPPRCGATPPDRKLASPLGRPAGRVHAGLGARGSYCRPHTPRPARRLFPPLALHSRSARSWTSSGRNVALSLNWLEDSI